MFTEKIERAAVRVTGTFAYIGAQTLVFEVPRPLRHDAAILAATAALRLDRIGEHEQGFVTSTGRFVDREEAGRIAHHAHQTTSPRTCLTTENLW